MSKYSLDRFLKIRPRSEKEIRDKLKFKKFEESEIDKIIKDLKSREIINDRIFAQWWVYQRTEYKPRGKRFIEFELKRFGVDLETIQSVLPDEDIESKMAHDLAEYKIKSFSGLPKFDKKRKLFAYLSGKGFSFDIVRETVDDIIE